MAGSDALDFSFLSQEAAGPAVPPPAGAVAGAAATAAAAAAPHAPVSVSLAARSQPDGLHTVPDSWTLWDSNRQGQHRGGGAGGAAAHHGGAHQPAGAGAEPAAAGGTSFTRAFAHMKERPGYEPPPARAQQQPAAQAGGQSARPGGAAAAAHARTIQVSRRQTNNPVLRCIRNVPWEYAEIAADYQLGSQTCCLFLSLRYHLLKPKYIYTRMEALQRGFRLRVLLCMVDTEDNTKTLIDVHKVTVVNGWTLILAWSPEEAARYLETYQTYEHKQADNIQQRIEGDYLSRATDVLTTIRSVNRTDVANLSTSLGSLACMMAASKERLALCPGVGDKKVQRIYEAFHQPFLASKKPRTES
eukprot:Tamp_18120.p1 GENE.Tamp_18120~~Tamp_18120.p1  ORF type:complete len:418 (+),score=101.20 Tamp_18120:180-1256(+)